MPRLFLKEKLWSRLSRRYGKAVGSRPAVYGGTLIIGCMVLILVGWWEPLFVSVEKVIRPLDFTTQWAVSGSAAEFAASQWAAESSSAEDWTMKFSTTIAIGKGGYDLLTPEALNEVLLLQQEWMNLSLTFSDNIELTMWDLCPRGDLSDLNELCERYEPAASVETSSTTTVTHTTTETSTTSTTTTTRTSTSTQAHSSASLAWEFVTDQPSTETQTTTEDAGVEHTATATSTSASTKFCDRSPMLPCLMISPVQCFQEQSLLNDELYTSMDPGVAEFDELFLPYSTRPSFRELDSASIRVALSGQREDGRFTENKPPGRTRGCHWYTSQGFFPVDAWAGRARWNGTTTDGPSLASVDAIRMLLYFDGSKRIVERLQQTKPHLASEALVKKAIRAMAARWHETVIRKNEELSFLEVSNMDPWEYLEEALPSDPDTNYLFAAVSTGGTILVIIIYPLMLLDTNRPQVSRGCVALQGFGVIWLSMLTASSLFLLSGFRVTLLSVLMLPFLGWSLGLEHLFVLLRYFANLGSGYLVAETGSEIAAELLAGAGPGMLLSLFSNVIMFGSGIAIPIVAVQEFCIGALFLVLCNFFLMVNVFVPLLVLEGRRVKAVWPDLHPAVCLCQRRAIRREVDEDPWAETEPVKRFHRNIQERAEMVYLRRNYTKLITMRRVQIVVVVILAGAFPVAVWNCGNGRAGYDPEEFLQHSTDVHDTIKMAFDSFSLFPSELCFRGLDVASRQLELLQLFEAVTSGDFAVDGPFTNQLSMMYHLMRQRSGDVSWEAAIAAAEESGDSEALALAEEMLAQSVGLNISNVLQGLAPLGTATSDGENFTSTLLDLLSLPTSTETAWLSTASNGTRASLFLDLAGSSMLTWYEPENTTASVIPRIRFGTLPFFTAAMDSDEDYFTAVADGAAKLSSSVLKDATFIHGAIFNYWQVLADLEIQWSKLHLIFVFSSLGGAVLCLTVDLGSLLIGVLCTYILFVSTWGLMVTWCKINAFFVGGMLVCIGLSMDAVAHIIASYAYAEGSAPERLGQALTSALPATLASSTGIIITLSPLLLFAPLFHLKYLLGPLAANAVLCLFMNLMLLPALLGLVSPPMARMTRPCWILLTVCVRRWRAWLEPEHDGGDRWRRFIKGDS